MVIKLKENYMTNSITGPRKLLYSRRDVEIKETRKLVSGRMIERVVGRPIEFCSPTICLIRPDGTIRFSTYFAYFHKQVIRTVHPVLSTCDAIHSIDAESNFFSTFDCKKTDTDKFH